MSLRPYQNEALSSIKNRKVQRGIVALPTGTGKGHIAGHITDVLNTKKILYLAHRSELINQLADHVERVLGFGMVEVEQADNKAVGCAPAVIASVPTLTAMNCKRLNKFKPGRFDAIVVDEAHHCHAPGTLIDTVIGKMRIEDIAVGEYVMSYNEGRIEPKKVVNTFSYQYKGVLLKITTANGAVVVTKNHKMYSNGVKVYAGSLKENQTISLPILRLDNDETVCCRWACNIKSPIVAGDKKEHVQEGYAGEVSESGLLCSNINPHEEKESNGKRCCEVQNDKNNKKENRCRRNCCLWKSKNDGERMPANESRGEINGEISAGGSAICGCAERRTTTLPLQDRCGMAGPKNRSGHRRIVSQFDREKDCGCTERASASLCRMEIAEGQKRRCVLGESRIFAIEPQYYAGLIYDIEVEDYHNYIANGLLSSNSTADSYLKIWKHFGLLDDTGQKTASPVIPLIGLTATPGRGDGVGLNNIFDEILYQMSLQKAIEDGWLVPVYAWTINTTTSLDGVKTRLGDYAEGELAKAVCTDSRNEIIFEACQNHAKGLKTLIFCVNIEHSMQVAEYFRRNGVQAKHISGDMKEQEREGVLNWFSNTPGAVLTNCQLVTEGVDIPSVECVVMARPTKSGVLYAQCLGRGTRLAKGAANYAESVMLGKDRLVLLDVVDLTREVGRRAVNISDIFGSPLPAKPLKGAEMVSEVKAQLQQIENARHGKVSGLNMDLVKLFTVPAALEGSTLAWLDYGGTYRLSLAKHGDITIQSDALDRWDVLYRTESNNKTVLFEHVGEQALAVRKAETWVRVNCGDIICLVDASAGWRKEPPTDAQFRMCMKLRIPIQDGMTKGQVSMLIDRALSKRKALR